MSTSDDDHEAIFEMQLEAARKHSEEFAALKLRVRQLEAEREVWLGVGTRAEARVRELEESNAMACLAPPSGCDCAGCAYAAEKLGNADTQESQ